MKPKPERDFVAHLILKKSNVALRALLALYDRQTPLEQATAETLSSNGRGFNKTDANTFTKMAEGAIQRGYLTAQELAVCRKLDKRGVPRLAKYWAQILDAFGDQVYAQVAKKLPSSETSSGDPLRDVA
jgi:hypothetical protein